MVLSISLFSLVFKLLLISMLAIYNYRYSGPKKVLVLIILATLGSILSDVAWSLDVIKDIFQLNFSWHLVAVSSRIAWAFFIVQYQAISLLIEHLSLRRPKIKKNHLFLCALTTLLFLYFIILAFFEFNNSISSSESYLNTFGKIYLFILVVPRLYLCTRKIHSKKLPKILSRQLQILINYFIIPQILLELLNTKIIFSSINLSLFILLNNYTVHTINTILISFALYYSCKRMLNLRFLNFKDHVQAKNKYKFIVDFKNTLEEFSHLVNMQELVQSTQTFFEKAFGIPHHKIKLYIRKTLNEEYNQDYDSYHDLDTINTQIERFLIEHNSSANAIIQYLRKHKIVIKDELEFNNFYKKEQEQETIISFLNLIHADVFLPVYNHQSIIAYIVIEQNARDQELYSNIERDEMLVFTSYLGKIISLLRHNDLNVLLKDKKEMEEELYNKHQEIKQYKESISAFLKIHQQRKHGLIFYKNNRLTIANQEAQELIGIDIYEKEGYSIAQKLKKIARMAQQYKSTQSESIKDFDGNTIIISAIPSIDQDIITLMIYYPEVFDRVNPYFAMLKDPSKWEYILSLETTNSGQLINKLIPSNSEVLLNFKINLLNTALSKKATLLDLPAKDLLPTVELLHHISLRSALHLVNLNQPEKGEEAALKLFGINPLLIDNHELHHEPLLQALDNSGTLFIQNVDFLSLSTQNLLANFLAYGFFSYLKSELKIFSNVRVICSTNKNLSFLVSEGKFSKSLFNELNKTVLSMPPLVALPQAEIRTLTNDITEQALKSEIFKSLLELTTKEKSYLIEERPLSITEFKEKIQDFLTKKSDKHNIYTTYQTTFDPAYNIADPEVAQAVRLGKKALKDPHMMNILWNKFQNQNKIATLLGVNRSSVNRRCKEYSLY